MNTATKCIRGNIARPTRLCSIPLQVSCCTRRYTSAPAPKPESGRREQARRAGGSYTSILATLAVSATAGWAIHEYTDAGTPSVAKPADFVRYAVVKKEEVSSTCSIFTLKPAAGTLIDMDGLYEGRAITSVQFKQPQLQIARAYTVLPPVEEQDPHELRFLIRKEKNGEVSGYLHRLPLGAEVELRGPSVDYVLPENMRKVIFLAGGTGIAPAMQVASKLGQEGDMHILWATRHREDCEGGVSDTVAAQEASGWSTLGWRSLFGIASSDDRRDVSAATGQDANASVAQLEALKQTRNGAVKVDYFVDDEGSFVTPKGVTELLRRNGSERDECRLLIVSGPEGFVKYWAGPKQWSGGREVQGPLGGVLSGLNLHGHQVIKL
ncbi:hypothetical protein B0A50_07790 [Salinomyces thailandicus]|uniref:FAD-binding FR-type domain-containing protein n=1 Tax=Salinomyces thailandicus TaxID=706561 RepID=A0A4U0TLI6_9PEZI|nr:hypothetical protein B0A50_07790 [Salinomyces thailandica]